MKALLRNTTATRRRSMNFRRLVNWAHGRPHFEASEICEILNLSPSGARKYIGDALDAGLLIKAAYVKRISGNGITYLSNSYILTTDETVIKHFFDQHPATEDAEPDAVTPATTIPSTGFNGYLKNQSRSGIYSDRARAVARLKIKRDPLVAALFGGAKS